jgi:hypothetical protein
VACFDIEKTAPPYAELYRDIVTLKLCEALLSNAITFIIQSLDLLNHDIIKVLAEKHQNFLA